MKHLTARGLWTNSAGRKPFATARAANQGFTLLELMIVVAVMAILATIAYSSYQSQVMKSRRAAAAACLQERAQAMERYYTTSSTLSYLDAPDPAPCGPELEDFYQVSYSQEPTTGSPRTYTLQIVPQGSQEADTKCGTLTINQQGLRTHDGSSTDEKECW